MSTTWAELCVHFTTPMSPIPRVTSNLIELQRMKLYGVREMMVEMLLELD